MNPNIEQLARDTAFGLPVFSVYRDTCADRILAALRSAVEPVEAQVAVMRAALECPGVMWAYDAVTSVARCTCCAQPKTETHLPECHLSNALSTDAGSRLLAELQTWREHAALSDKEFLALEDALIGNAEIDPKTGIIDRAAKCRERIRDLIAAEGEVGDLRDRLAKAEAVWQHCKIVYYPQKTEKDIYPMEHDLMCKKDMRARIEAALERKAQ